MIDLVAGRDFTPDGTIEAAEIRDGDVCPACASAVEIARGIEIGHIFQLGRKYAEALGPHRAGRERQARSRRRWAPTASASPGRWPRSPRRATTTSASCGHARSRRPTSTSWSPASPTGPQFPAGEQLAADLEAAGLRVLLDDRYGPSPGVKFKDAELIGIPTIAVVGRGVADEENPTIEVKDRKSGDRDDIALADVVAHLVATCH